MRRLLFAAMGVFTLAACTENKPEQQKAKSEEPVPENSAPTLASIDIEGDNFTLDSTITVTLGKAADPDGDEVTFKYQWYVNGTAEPGAVGDSLAGAFAKGDEVFVAVTPTDGTNDGKPVESETITIANTPPVAATVSLGAGPYRKADTITAFASGSDADGDVVTFTFRWFVNGSYISTGPSLAGAFAKSDVVTAEATPYDGTDHGEPVSTAGVSIQNSAPVITSNSLGNGPFYRNDTLTAAAAGADPDGDGVTFSYRWFINGSEVGGASSPSLSGPFAVDDLIAVEATPNDGNADGAPMLSGVVSIGNRAPSTPILGVYPAIVTADTQTLWAAVITPSTDADGDAIAYDFAWYRNDLLQSYPATQTSISAADLVAGDTWRVEVAASDGATSSASATVNRLVYFQATTVAAGNNHTCAITKGGGVKCWGKNDAGQLGNGGIVQQSYPVGVSGLTSGVTGISAGLSHTCALTYSGGVKCWGENSSGQLGDGTSTDRRTPIDVSGLTSGVLAIAAGQFHTCALTAGGGIKCWGDNSNGQIGNGGYAVQRTPVNVTGLTSGMKAVAAGYWHTCGLTTGGGMKCWGNNTDGELGNGNTTDQPTAVDATGLTTGIQAIAAGDFHTCALTTGGGAKCWGFNSNGQLGNGNTTNQLTAVNVTGLASGVVALSAGYTHTCAVLSSGNAKCWGNNDKGQLGNGNITQQLTPVTIPALAGSAKALALGDTHTCAVSTSGSIKCWGDNGLGELGNGYAPSQYTPVDVQGLSTGIASVAVGAGHVCAATIDGSVKCWGYNADGQVGNGNTDLQLNATTVLGLAGPVQALATGRYHSCALGNGSVKCWGQNVNGQLGNGFSTSVSTPVQVTSLTSGVQSVTAGGQHTCALVNGGVKCWGLNEYGIVGNGGTVTPQLTPSDVVGLTGGVASIAAGSWHTCALNDAGGVKCWGANFYGELGDGSTIERPYAVDVSGLTSGVKAIASGEYFSCALMTGGTVKCWGLNNNGMLGNGTTTSQLTPADVVGLSDVESIAAWGYHACALKTGGEVVCWGGNYRGQIGSLAAIQQTTFVSVPGLTTDIVTIEAGQSNTCAISSAGALKCWGDKSAGQLGPSLTSLIPALAVFGFVP